jgi:hypothetical protein
VQIRIDSSRLIFSKVLHALHIVILQMLKHRLGIFFSTLLILLLRLNGIFNA